MKILLAYPYYPDTFWSFKYALRFIGKQASFPPMGLLTVASMLPGSWELKLCDENVSPISDDQILWADYVFVSAMTVQKQSSIKLIERCHKLGRKVVAGGPLFTALYEEFQEVDHLVLDEAELTLQPFINDVINGTAKPLYRADEFADMAQTPVPRWDLVDFKNYATLCVQYSRGCPFDCEFCDITVLYGRKCRTRPVENLIAEFDALYERGWRGGVFIVDDNFIGNKKLLKRDILPEIIKWMKAKKYPFSFLTQCSINLADDDELMKMMAAAGFDMVFIGIETPDDESLAECGKHHNRGANMMEQVNRLHRNGLQVQAGFIVGFDSDKTDIFQRISNFINESGIVASMVGLLNAPPGTRLYKRLASENRILKGISGDNTDMSMNFLPKMDAGVLLDGYKKIIRDIYNPEDYYKRIRQFLKSFKVVNKYNGGMSCSYLRPFLNSLYRLGIKPGVRFQFWKLFIWTLLRRPRLVPHAITMAIYGAHFMNHFNVILK